MKEILGVPTYGMRETLESTTPDIPDNFFGEDMKEWIAYMSNLYGPEYIQKGVWKSLVGNIKQSFDTVLDAIEYTTIYFGLTKIEDGLTHTDRDFH